MSNEIYIPDPNERAEANAEGNLMIDDELKQILDNAPIVFGLKNQGHLPTIERMLDEAWERIGKEIGWCPKTAREHYERIARAANAAEIERLKLELHKLQGECGHLQSDLAELKRDITTKAEAAAREIAEFEYDAHGYAVGTDTIELIINSKFTQEARP